MDIADLLEDNALTEFYGLLPSDFKKFIRPKKELINKELCKLLPKIYYNFTNVFL